MKILSLFLLIGGLCGSKFSLVAIPVAAVGYFAVGAWYTGHWMKKGNSLCITGVTIFWPPLMLLEVLFNLIKCGIYKPAVANINWQCRRCGISCRRCRGRGCYYEDCNKKDCHCPTEFDTGIKKLVSFSTEAAT